MYNIKRILCGLFFTIWSVSGLADRPTVVGSWSNSGMVTGLTITIPPDIVDVGDTLVVVAARDTTGVDTITFNEAGWLETGTGITLGELNFTNAELNAAYRIATSDDADGITYQINGATARGLAATIIAVRGDPTTPILAAASNTPGASLSTTSTPPSQTIASNDSLFLALLGYTDDPGVITPPTDHILRGQASYTVSQTVWVYVYSFDADTAESPVNSGYSHVNSVRKGTYSLVFGPYTPTVIEPSVPAIYRHLRQRKQ